MTEKEKLVKVQFWSDPKFRKEITEFAHSYNLSAADLYKAGAILMKKLLENPAKIELNLFTSSFKDLEQSRIRKEILKASQGSKREY